MGIGIILLALVAGGELLTKRGENYIDHRAIVPLLCVSLGLTVLALSNRVAVGHVELFTYEIPDRDCAGRPYSRLLGSAAAFQQRVPLRALGHHR